MKKIIYTIFLFPFLLFAQNIDVADSATLLIDTGGTMTISGTLTSNTSGSIIIATSRTASGSLIAVDAGNSQGKGITLRRSLDGSNEWALIGVPVTGESSSDIDDNLQLAFRFHPEQQVLDTHFERPEQVILFLLYLLLYKI
jgi:hypothetical protein